MEPQMTTQRPCDHGRWPEANVGQQYRKGPDHLMHPILTVLTTINPEKRPAVGSRPRSSLSRPRVRMDPGRDPTAGLFSGLIVVSTVKIWCIKRSGPFRYCWTSATVVKVTLADSFSSRVGTVITSSQEGHMSRTLMLSQLK